MSAIRASAATGSAATATAQSGPVLAGRPLGGMEHAFWLLDRATPMNGVSRAKLRGPIHEQHIRAALDRVRRRHPLLAVAVREGVPPAFVPVEAELPLRVVRGAGAKAAAEVVEDELNRRFQPGELLWRAVWLEGEAGGELVLAQDHVIVDAQSAVIMMRDTVEALGAILGGGAPEAAATVVPRPLCPPLTALLRRHLGLWEWMLGMTAFGLRHLFTKLLRRPRRLPLDHAAAYDERRLHLLHCPLTERETEALVRSCRQEGTTVQGAIGAAMLLATAEALDLQRPAWLGCFSGVSLRARVPVTDDDMGLYTAQAATYHRLDRRRDPWALARELKRDLTRAIRNREQLVTLPLIGIFLPWALRLRRWPGRRAAALAARFHRRFDLASPTAVGVTNVGRADLPAGAGPVAIESFDLTVGPSVVSPMVACVATHAGRLTFNVVYVAPLLGHERARALVAATRRWLTAAM